MRFIRVVSLLLGVFFATPPLHAEPNGAGASTGPSFGDRFFRGTSPGELPAAKVLVVSTLYAASLASIAVGIATLVRSSNQGADAERYKTAQDPYFCNDVHSDPCKSYLDKLEKQNNMRTSGLALLGAGGFALLGGALTAELWPNSTSTPRVALALDGKSAGFLASGRF
jgi:hypothetical protein